MPPKSNGELIRGLGVWAAGSLVVGNIVGSGIFLVSSSMIRGVETPEAVFLVWIFGGLLSLSGALAYAELGAMLPHSGGDYVYLREAYGRLWGFLYGWTKFLVMTTAAMATLAIAFALYFTFFFPSLPLKAVALAVLFVLGAVNYFGVRTGGAVQTFFTLLKVALLLALVLAALVFGAEWGDARWNHLQTAVPVELPLSGFVLALVAALWAYQGWNDLNLAGGEVADPQKNIPRSLLLGTVAVGLLYLLTNLAYFYILPAAEVAASDRVAGDVARRLFGGWGGGAVALAAMISIFGALNGSILSGARVPYAMARDGLLFGQMGAVHPRFHSPHVAVVVQTSIGALISLTGTFHLTGTFQQLFTYTIFANWCFYGLGVTSLFVLRRKHPEWPRPYRAWGYPVVPALFVAVSAVLVVMILRDQEWWRSLVGLGMIGLGVPAYFFFRNRAWMAGRVSLAAVIALLALNPATAQCADRAAGSKPAPELNARKEVVLFALNEEAGLESLRLYGSRATAVSPQWFAASADGNLSGEPWTPLLDLSRQLRIPLTPLVINRDFSPEVAAKLLRSPRARARLVRELLARARRYNLQGYVIDFENLRPDAAQRRHFSEFLGELRTAHSRTGLSLGVALPPPSPRYRQTFDYRAAGQLADRVLLMAYDQHSGSSAPGPIAGYRWVEARLRETVALIPERKLLLGLAFYHRNWGEDGATSGGYQKALALQQEHQADWRWDSTHRAHWFGFLRQGQRHTVWVEDAWSVAEKLALARRYQLAGVAGWRLGQEDPAIRVLLRQFQSN